MSDGPAESIPIFDLEDAKLVGWEIGVAGDGDWVLQSRCEGCGTAHSIKLPPGAFIHHDPDDGLIMQDGELYGPMKPPAVREMP